MDFIKRTNFSSDYNRMKQDLDNYLSLVGGWPEQKTINGKYYSGNQLSVKHRVNAVDPIYDCVGNLYDKENQRFFSLESDFTEYNQYLPDFTRTVIEQLEQHERVKFGRIRYMRLMSKTGLSVHKDFETRYHYVFDTNVNAFFGEKTEGELAAKCYHIPKDSFFYKVDVTREHFVYNGGWEPRIHLVLNVAENL
jgi:hypothetical protein